MSLINKQAQFATAIGRLLVWCADNNHTTVTFGDAYRDPRLHGAMGEKKAYGAANSVHKLRLAVDLNLIINGKLAQPADYAPLHDYWDTLGGAERIANDMNHFSFEHNGFR